MTRDEIIAHIEQHTGVYDAITEAVGGLIMAGAISEDYGERIIDEYSLSIPEE